MTHEADGVLSVELVDPAGAPLPEWAPGAHVDVRTGNGLVRQYSLCGDPARLDRYRVGVLREPDGRGGSAYVHTVLRPGDVVGLTGPRNNFELRPSPRYLFVAGGVGVTPILPMVHRADAEGADWRLVYGGRTRASMAFLDELEGYGARVAIVPQDRFGLLDLDRILEESGPDAPVYCCGPEPLLAAMEERCGERGRELFVERFAARPVDPATLAEGRAFEVVCARSGLTVEIGPEQTILAALREAGLDVESSCEEGICGTCETRVLEGEPDHRDSLLSTAEREAGTTMMICCSRSRSDRLVIDR